jgi:hypothetical protein
MIAKSWAHYLAATFLGGAMLLVAAPSDAQTVMRVMRPVAQSGSAPQDNSGCPANRKSSGLCFGTP